MAGKKARATAISSTVKKAVMERDGCCVWCGRPGLPEAHYISRAQFGLGIEQNILALCRECHNRYDRTGDRQQMRKVFRQYLQSKYPDWNEDDLIYRKKW